MKIYTNSILKITNMADIKIAQLLKAGVHFGHKTPRWNPKMFPYIYMERNGIHILDLVQTSQLLQEACDFVQEAAEQRKTFLFVGTKPQAVEIIKDEAIRCESFYVNHRWYGGLLTNWQTVKGRIATLKKLEEQEETVFPTLPKKEAASLISTLKPASPSLPTTSARPPEFVETTGTPLIIASAAVKPKDSHSCEAINNISA